MPDSGSGEIALTGAILAGEDKTARDAQFAALVHRQSRFVFRVAFAILRNPDECEDVVQETFLRLYRGKNWDQLQNERAFLARTAWRIAVNRLPKKRGGESNTEVLSQESGLEQVVIRAERIATVHKLIDGLPEELRQALALSTVDELTSPEISAILGISEGTVRTRLARARQLLKQKLDNLP